MHIVVTMMTKNFQKFTKSSSFYENLYQELYGIAEYECDIKKVCVSIHEN